MSELKATHPLALQFLITEDLYMLDEIAPAADEAPQQRESVEKHPQIGFQGFDYIGENNKYFLLIVNEPSHKSMLPKELEALKSILGAKKMEMTDVALVNYNRYSTATIQQFKDFFACSKIVLFGVNPQLLQLPALPSNKISDFQGMKILATFGFAEMMDNVDKKKAFWAEMKNL